VRYDAIIIGSGPAGATAALMLARAGWSVAVVEKSSFPRRKVCGEFISATSMPLLDELGLLDDFLQCAGPEVRRVGLFAKDIVLTATMPRAMNRSGQCGRALGREHLDLLVLRAAQRAGAKVWQPWKAIRLHRSGADYECTIASADGSEQLTAPIVIAAHGSWEHGTLPSHTSSVHKPSDLLAFKAHFTNCDLAADLMPLLAFPGGYGGMVHSDGGRVSLSCCIRRDQLKECRRKFNGAHAAEAVLHHIRISCAGVREALHRATLDHVWLSAGPIHPGLRQCCTDGIFLIGNCAGEAHPVVAEGISMAMQSAALLCRRLIARQADALAGQGTTAIGSDYATAWKRLFAPRIYTAALFANLAMSPAAAIFLLPLLKFSPRILTFGAHLSGKTNHAIVET
jgi:flavin-dependent dehydrogenase